MPMTLSGFRYSKEIDYLPGCPLELHDPPIAPDKYGLIYEFLPYDGLFPWRMLIACALSIKTPRRRLIPVLRRIYFNYPDPYSFAIGNRSDIDFLLKPIGRHEARAMRIQRMSANWVMLRKEHQLDDVGQIEPGKRKVRGQPIKFYKRLPGVDAYGHECIRLFVDGDLTYEPQAEDLKGYVAWARTYYKDYLRHEIFQRRLQGIAGRNTGSSDDGTANGNNHGD